MSSTSPLFITSLAPRSRPGIQAAAITSWQQLGGRILSANQPDEIDCLKTKFPQVDFHPLTRSAQAQAGKPVPLIDDLLDIARQTSPQAPCVLINADIVLMDRPRALASVLARAADGILVCGARLDVDDVAQAEQALQDRQPLRGEIARGYDYFVLPPSLATRLPSTRLALGMPFWDYWLPLAALIANIATVCVEAPFALHERHDSKWDHTKFTYFRTFMDATLAQLAPSDPTPGAEPLSRSLAWQMIRYEHALLLEQATAPEAPPQAQSALADFYDRQFAVFVHHIKAMTPLFPLP